jgi:hypothetical protein
MIGKQMEEGMSLKSDLAFGRRVIFWRGWRRVILRKGDDLVDMRHHFFKMLPCED